MENKNENLLMAPEWLMYPNIPYGSIGWRMGYGERYAMDFYRWFNKLEDDEKITFIDIINIGHIFGKKIVSVNMI